MSVVQTVQLANLPGADTLPGVIALVEPIWFSWYDKAEFSVIEHAAQVACSLFEGSFPGFHACDTEYHDAKHTIAVTLAIARLLDGRNAERGAYAPELASDLVVAALFHDAGYIRKEGEEGCTGARFTREHVFRSTRFVIDHGTALGLSESRAQSVGRLIFATGLKGEFGEQAYERAEEREAGALLGTGDLLGQMSDRAYLEKLLFLYYEFKEAGFPGYETEYDILKKTFDFYETTVGRLTHTLDGVYKYAESYFLRRHGIPGNLYMEAIARQMSYLDGIVRDDSVNFRKKLKRMDFERLGANGRADALRV